MAQQNGLPDLPFREESSSDEENNVHYCGVLLLKKQLPADVRFRFLGYVKMKENVVKMKENAGNNNI
ncbi:hypothetical protein MKW92_000683 [Papaver armeniacum]|nr:hypothetical protein MKW92_000683 [Papaver armeniacum]